MSWLDDLPAPQRAALSGAGRIGYGRFEGPNRGPVTVEPPVIETTPQRMLVSVREAAEMMGGIDRDTVYTLCNTGQLPNVRLGRRILVSVEGIREWIARNDQTGILAGM